jgi:hypothetical protein
LITGVPVEAPSDVAVEPRAIGSLSIKLVDPRVEPDDGVKVPDNDSGDDAAVNDVPHVAV